MDAAGKFLIDAGLNEERNIVPRLHHSTAEGVVPRRADALRQPHRSIRDPMGPSARGRFDLLATSSGNDRYLALSKRPVPT